MSDAPRIRAGETWEEYWNRTQGAEYGTWAEVKARTKPGEFIETSLTPEQLRAMPAQPECPYWQDGRHCYEMMFKPEARELNRKTCACGHEVKPR